MDNFVFIINKFLNGDWNLIEIKNNSKFYSFYLNSKKIENDPIKYENIVNILNKSELTNTYFKVLEHYNSNLISQNDIHGISHIIRTSLFLLIISVLEKININDFKIVLESILYHDIGRINDIDDDNHGYNATKKISFLKNYYNEQDYNMICALITGHCLDDNLYNKIATFYFIDDIDRYYKLLSIVKDADALDRVREYPYVDIKFLRTISSKKILSFAYEFYNSYEIN